MHIPLQQYMRAHLRQAASHCMCHRVVYATLIDKNAELQQSPCPIQPDYCRAAPHKGEIAVRTLIRTPFSTALQVLLAGWGQALHINLARVTTLLPSLPSLLRSAVAVDLLHNISPAGLRAVSGEHIRAGAGSLLSINVCSEHCIESDGQTRGLLARCRASEPGELMLGSASPTAGSNELCSLRLS